MAETETDAHADHDAAVDVDVVIVGAGIAGPALAAALAPHDVSVMVIERRAEPPDTLRGDHLQPRTLEILEGWGALDDLRRLGAEQRDGTVWQHGDETIVRAMTGELDLAHPHFLFLDHELIHQGLLTAAARNDRFTFHRPIAGVALGERGSTATVVDIDHGDHRTSVRARVVVGADGQGSSIRHAVGITADVHRYGRPISIFFAPWTEAPDGNCLVGRIAPGGIVALVPRSAGRCKIAVATDPDALATWRQLEPDEIRRRLVDLAGELPVGAPRHMGTYPPVRIVADRWVDGNVVLLGDACHAMHPAQSQGMNVSIRCADALARTIADALGGGRTDVAGALGEYERSVRPAIEPILAANHQAGLVFDSTDPAMLTPFVEMLRGVGASEAATRAYALATAGYPPG